jgi:hypothetical protein
MIRQRDLGDAGKCRDRAGHALIEIHRALRRVVARGWKEAEADDAPRIESRIDVAECPEAPHEEASSDQENECERHLERDKR